MMHHDIIRSYHLMSVLFFVALDKKNNIFNLYSRNMFVYKLDELGHIQFYCIPGSGNSSCQTMSEKVTFYRRLVSYPHLDDLCNLQGVFLTGPPLNLVSVGR